MESEKNNEHKTVFGLAITGDKVPLLIIGLTPKAIEHLQTGQTHNIDLLSVGVPIRILMFSCADHMSGVAAITKALTDANKKLIVDAKGLHPNDFKIDPDVAAGRNQIKPGEKPYGATGRPSLSLSDEINENITRSEILGGVKTLDIKVGEIIYVQTRNTLYRVRREIEGLFIIGHPDYCPDWTMCTIYGSTFGGTMLKLDFIGRDMHLEFSTHDYPRRIMTSKIQEVYE